MKNTSKKPIKQTHTARTKFGMGDFYGTGVRQNVGRVRESYTTTSLSPKKMGKPPKTLA